MHHTNPEPIRTVHASRKELLACQAQGNEADCFLDSLIGHFKTLTAEITALTVQAAKIEDMLLDCANAPMRTCILIDHDGQLRVRPSARRKRGARATPSAQIERIEMTLRDTERRVNLLRVELCDVEEMILLYEPKTILGGLRKSRILLEIVAADKCIELDHYLNEIYDAICLSEEITVRAT
jgi:hypothetical protein